MLTTKCKVGGDTDHVNTVKSSELNKTATGENQKYRPTLLRRDSPKPGLWF